MSTNESTIIACFQRVVAAVKQKSSSSNAEESRQQLVEIHNLLQPGLDKDLALRKLVLSGRLSKLSRCTIDIDINALRARIWQRFLGVPCLPQANEYQRKLELEPKLFDAKIRDDSFRTFKGVNEFWTKVTEDEIIRVLNAISADSGYVQGMNVLLGPFIFIMPELDSYYCLKALVQTHIPRYVSKNLDGVHVGIRLTKQCLSILDPKLYNHLQAKIPDFSIFSLRYVMTLMANMKPLSEVLVLWDAVFAFGVHFNIILLCSKLIIMRDDILSEKRGSRILLKLEAFRVEADALIEGALSLVQFLPKELFEEMVGHPTTREDAPR
mmetsp:Transcript_10580/g.17250  ORF Transcript_10580/g.17250 Transcript_10580/m.17250 type:complete len:325 (+) Transcript_10580:30-1004(+)